MTPEANSVSIGATGFIGTAWCLLSCYQDGIATPGKAAVCGRRGRLLAGPDGFEHAGVEQRRGVAEFAAFGDIAQESAHDFAAAGFG